MKRREALKKIGLGLSAGCVSPWLMGCEKPSVVPDVRYDGTVVVVGAGAAGLYLASILYSRGIDVSVLEARDNIGGRVSSYDRSTRNVFSQSFPVELGANLIHGSNSILADNIAAAGIPVTEVGKNFEPQFVIGNMAKTAAGWGGDVNFSEAKGFVDSLSAQSGSGDMTIAQAISGYSDSAKTLLNSWVGNLYGASNDLIGLSPLAENLGLREYNTDILALKGNLLLPFLYSRFYAEKYPLIVNAPVTSIDYSDIKINIAYGAGLRTEADKVVVTVPVSMLKSNKISFNPGLPSHMVSAINNIGMGQSLRVVIEFKKNFWGEATDFIWGLPSAPTCFINGIGSQENTPSNMMMITINGPKATELANLGQNMIHQILVELDAIYDGQATQFVRRDFNTSQVVSVVKNWGEEEYIQGGYSYPTVSTSMNDYISLGSSINGRLFFAGEATDRLGYAGTLNGALNSAERVADDVIQSIFRT